MHLLQVFQFKHFAVRQELCAMRVGTDSMLLGCWTQPQDACRMLDVGTGTGMLALMMAQKSLALIDAIDVDASAINQASFNAKASPWADQIRVHQSSLQDWAESCNTQYDVIISNPPYYQHASKPWQDERATARHSDVQLPFGDLVRCVTRLLAPTGRLSLVLPVPESQVFLQLAAELNLHLRKLLKVRTHAGDVDPVRYLMELGLGEHGSIVEEELCIREQRHDAQLVYSNAYRTLTAEFHLPSVFSKQSNGTEPA